MLHCPRGAVAPGAITSALGRVTLALTNVPYFANSKAVRLFRPTGLRELRLVADAAWQAWPPRLPDQPIFYPVLTLEYARKIARDWNAVDDNVGFVTEFDIDDLFAARYPIQDAAGRSHQELWVPAEELPEFNRHILGTIRVIEAFAGPKFSAAIDPHTNLPVGFEDRCAR